MKWIASNNYGRVEIVSDYPDLGYYVYVFDANQNCIQDYLQDTLKDAIEFASEDLGIHPNDGKEEPNGSQ